MFKIYFKVSRINNKAGDISLTVWQWFNIKEHTVISYLV